MKLKVLCDQWFGYFKIPKLIERHLFSRLVVGQLAVPISRSPMLHAAAGIALDTGDFVDVEQPLFPHLAGGAKSERHYHENLVTKCHKHLVTDLTLRMSK